MAHVKNEALTEHKIRRILKNVSRLSSYVKHIVLWGLLKKFKLKIVWE